MYPMQNSTLRTIVPVLNNRVSTKLRYECKFLFALLDTKKNLSIEDTGLGLAISQNLAGLMGSDITVTSVYDEGSTFSFEVEHGVTIINSPLTSQVLVDALNEETASEESADINNSELDLVEFKSVSVLIVDNNDINLIIAENALLGFSGVSVDLAISRPDVISAVERNHYDFVLTKKSRGSPLLFNFAVQLSV